MAHGSSPYASAAAAPAVSNIYRVTSVIPMVPMAQLLLALFLLLHTGGEDLAGERGAARTKDAEERTAHGYVFSRPPPPCSPTIIIDDAEDSTKLESLTGTSARVLFS